MQQNLLNSDVFQLINYLHLKQKTRGENTQKKTSHHGHSGFQDSEVVK